MPGALCFRLSIRPSSAWFKLKRNENFNYMDTSSHKVNSIYHIPQILDICICGTDAMEIFCGLQLYHAGLHTTSIYIIYIYIYVCPSKMWLCGLQPQVAHLMSTLTNVNGLVRCRLHRQYDVGLWVYIWYNRCNPQSHIILPMQPATHKAITVG